MSVRYYKAAVAFLNDGRITMELTPDEGGTPVPTPSPVPTPAPTPAPTPPPSNVPTQEVPFQAQKFQHVEPGIVYYMKLPFPFTMDLGVQFGAGNEGVTPTHLDMRIADSPDGGAPTPYPQTKECDPAGGGDTIYASLNPNPLWQARVTSDRQWYCCFSVNMAGGIVYGKQGG